MTRWRTIGSPSGGTVDNGNGLTARRADVVVVGGGPVGLTVAAELASQGVRTVVFEQQTAVLARPRATTLHARAVQCLSRRGRLPWITPLWEAAAARPFRYAGAPGLTVVAPVGEPEPLLKIPQAQLERTLEAQARAAGARILRGHTVWALDQRADEVRVDANGPRGCVRYLARYVVGADGGRGPVRTLAGIGAQTWEPTVASLMGLVTLPDRRALAPGWHASARGWIVATALSERDVSVRTLNP